MEKCNIKYPKNYYIKALDNLQKYIYNYYNNTLNVYNILNGRIVNFKAELSKIDDSTLLSPNEIRGISTFKDFKESYFLFNELESLFSQIDEVYNNIINFDFFPEEEKSIDFSINSLLPMENNISNDPTQKSYGSKFYEYANLNDTNSKNNINNYNCSHCGKNDVNYIDQKKKELYCKACYEKLYYKIDAKEIDEKNESQANRINFLNSMVNLIKFIILECNEIIRIKENFHGIKKKVKYFKIDNIQEDYFNFLADINEIIQGEVNIDNFKLANLDQDIKQKIGDLFKRDVNFKANFAQEDDEDEESSSGELVNEVFNENSDHSGEKENEKIKEKLNLKENILNDFYYFINIVPKNNSKFDEKAKTQFENKLKIKINPNNFIVTNNNKYFIDNLVRNDNFLNLSLGEIKNLYPNLEELYEYKNIVDYLIKECDIKNYIDCKGNFIIKINDKSKTKEKYYPPYEWIGIGLKMKNNEHCFNNNYNDNEWAIAYYGVGGRLPRNEVKDKLKNKIKNGLEQGNSQTKFNMDDIRHPGKKIGTGVYLTPNIKLVENYCGIISFNNERYRVALMVKVRIDKIRQPKDINYWILSTKYIRPYRILLKKINKCYLN